MFNILIVCLFLINHRSGNDSSEEFFDFDENDLEELLEDKYELHQFKHLFSFIFTFYYFKWLC